MPGVLRGLSGVAGGMVFVNQITGFSDDLDRSRAALVVHAGIFPWQLGQETSVMFGLIFLGAATYFIYGALDPHWGNAVGQLAGFLAYDLVLLAPFLEHFSAARGGSLVSLIIYVAFLVYSGALASYYLVASNATRIRPAFIGSGLVAGAGRSRC